MSLRDAAVFATALAAAMPAAADGEFVTPPANLVLDGVPPVPLEVAKKLEPYGDFRPHGLLSWHPARREILIRRRLKATNQVHRVAEPGAAPEPLTDFEDAINGAAYEPTKGDYFVFSRGQGGNEVFRLIRYDIAARTATPLSPEGERTLWWSFNRKGDRLVYATQPIDKNNPDRTARTTLHIVDPLKPETDRVLAAFEGGGWSDFRFSDDGKRLAYLEYISANESNLWVMDLATRKQRRVTTQPRGDTVFYGQPFFTRDGKALIALSDRGSEFRRLAYIPLAPRGKERPLTPNLAFDVTSYDVSTDVNKVAFATNENGSSVLRFYDLTAMKELARPPLLQGVIGGVEWRRGSEEVGFHVASARTAGDVFSCDLKTRKVTRWTNGNNPAMNTNEFVEPKLIKWKSFDGREISGFLYQPPGRFTGKRPVIVNIHGGPEAQARPGFLARNNYFISELGVAMIFPNVRGSEGFGKTFLKLDNGMLREDSVKDIGALLDWIKQQPDLDGDRIMITGGSYGGYMTFASAVHFSDRIAGAVAVVGISNFVTFLERTESYRRDLRRAEYGDERDPKMRAFLESIAPVNNAEKIGKPLMVVQGLNDPRVPYTEAEQIVATLKRRGTPVWFILAKDEGHGFAKKPNADYQFYSTVEFARRTLLKE
jgi:dipeptidyl aminopeptidase/acylaminoacyl peptidase